MREFKFRVWIKNLKKMVYPNSFRWNEKGFSFSSGNYFDFGFGGGHSDYLSHAEFFHIMQFTGLTDSHSCDIFEEDIVGFIDPDDVNNKLLGRVVYNKSAACFEIEVKKSHRVSIFYPLNHVINRGRVVGNIYNYKF